MSIVGMFAAAILSYSGTWKQHDLQSSELLKDVRLQKNISLNCTNCSLGQFSQALSRDLKIPIKTEPKIHFRKINVVAKNRTASDIMQAVSQCLSLNWIKGNGGYRLDLSESMRDLEVAQAKLEKDRARSFLNQWVERQLKFSGMSPAEIVSYINKEQSRLNHEGHTLTESQKSSTRQTLIELSSLSVAVARIVKSTGALEAIVNGESIYASVSPVSGWHNLRIDELPPSYDNGKLQVYRDGQIRITFNSTRKHFSVAIVRRNEQSSDLVGPPFRLTVFDASSNQEGPLEREMTERASTGVDVKLGLSEVRSGRFKNPFYRNNLASLADHVGYLSSNSDISLVSDCYRQGLSAPAPMQGETISQYVTGLSGKGMPKSPFVRNVQYVWSSNGFLLMRHDQFWNLNTSEIPEEQLVPIESAITARGFSTLDDYARVAGLVNHLQMSNFDVESPSVFRFSKLPLTQSYHMLKLWQSLSEEDRKRLLSPDGLTSESLSHLQLSLLSEALGSVLWRVSTPNVIAYQIMARSMKLEEVHLSLAYDQRSPYQDPEFLPLPGASPSEELLSGQRFSFVLSHDQKRIGSQGAWLDKWRK